MLKIKLQNFIDSIGWTQADLAKESGVRAATICYMCNNTVKRLGVDNLNKICIALNCKLEDILEFIPDEKVL